MTDKLRRLICEWRGHRWNVKTYACTRCRRTQLEIVRSRRPAPTDADVTAAYWRGVDDGRKVDRRRAYRLGHQRGVRAALDVVLRRMEQW